MASTSNPEGSRFPIAKVTAFARLKLPTFTSRRGEPEVVFPPPSWEIDKLTVDGNGNKSRECLDSSSKREALGTGAVTEQAERTVSKEPPASAEESEPLTIAQRIRELIETLPIPGILAASNNPTTNNLAEARVLKAQDGSPGPLVPPGVDGELVTMLSSEEVMNGEEDEIKEEREKRKSIWSILSTMRLKGKDQEVDIQQAFTGDAREGLMMYSPLEPTNDSQVELAETRSATDVPTESSSHNNNLPNEKLEWVPSTTQISIYTTWWGYRLYLPPPVMDTLDSVSLKATAQAAMVTSALKWLLNKIPDVLVPVQLKGPLQLLKRLSPVVGYIGVFVAWSWGRIKAHDQGNGVVLTATWLLPVALIPMAWEAEKRNSQKEH